MITISYERAEWIIVGKKNLVRVKALAKKNQQEDAQSSQHSPWSKRKLAGPAFG
jgi:hypothetical protein